MKESNISHFKLPYYASYSNQKAESTSFCTVGLFPRRFHHPGAECEQLIQSASWPGDGLKNVELVTLGLCQNGA